MRRLATLFIGLAFLLLAGGAEAQVSAGFTCSVSGATADTVCRASPGAGFSFYVNSVVISNAGTAQTVRIITGTGTACGTGTAVVVPLLNMPVNGSVAISFRVPIKTAANVDICSDISGITAHSALIVGNIAP